MGRLANIQALVGVVESGSFSRAAERLGVAKSVVSRRVSALERGLGVQLLQRTTRNRSLTDQVGDSGPVRVRPRHGPPNRLLEAA